MSETSMCPAPNPLVYEMTTNHFKRGGKLEEVNTIKITYANKEQKDLIEALVTKLMLKKVRHGI